MSRPPEIRIVPDDGAVAEAAAEAFVASAAACVEDRGRFLVCLSGGSTPSAMHARLASPPFRHRVRWSHVQVCFGDERCVPPDHPDSNYGRARRALLDIVAGDDGPRVLRMEGERRPEDAARRYDRVLGETIGPDGRFDLIFLGLGEDGHTASLFPGTAALRETERRCVANDVGQKDAWRLTVTYPVLNEARQVLFLVTGAAKSAVLRRLFVGANDVERFPARGVQPTDGRVLFLVDRAAAAELPENLRARDDGQGEVGSRSF